MSEMVVIGYPDEATAEKAMNEVLRLQQDYMIQLDQIAIVEEDMNGKYKTHSPASPTAAGTTWGAFWGLLFGMLFFVPIAGMIFGGAMGAIFGGMAKAGLSKEWMQRVRDVLKPGTSALFMVIEKVTPDKVIDALKQYDGTVLRTSLSSDAEARLRDAMQGEEKVPAGTGTMAGSGKSA
jgi:uncharacterized membrane protein